MISNADIKAAWISKMKSNLYITSVVSSGEIREVEWKGTEFAYPNIRVKLQPLVPTTQSLDCRVFNSDVTIYVFSEEKSSKQADDIASVIAEQIWTHGFTVGNVKIFSVHLSGLDPAEVPEGDTNSWRSAVRFRSMVQPVSNP